MQIKTLLLLGAMSVAASGQAQTNWFVHPGGGGNDNGGEIRQIVGGFNSATNRFTWSANFGNNPGGQKTSGYWLVVSGGPNPKGHAGELAIFFMDASTAGSPKLTVYNYNGVNGDSSWYDGSGASGIQAPDKIKSSLATLDWVNSLTAVDNADGSRTIGFDINATSINSHTPAYPGSTPWAGAQFGGNIGVWLHPLTGVSSSYGADGFLKSFSYQNQGWLDLNDVPTSTVPEPATMATIGLGIAGIVARRRRKTA